MLLADVMSIFLLIVGFLLSLQGLWIVCRALWPARVSAAALRCERAPVACFFTGLLLTAGFAVVAAVIGKTLGTFGQLTAFAIWMVYFVYVNVGVSGFVTHIGQRLASPVDADRPWRATIRGGVALELAALVPPLLILPIALLIGAGATTLSFFGQQTQTTNASAPARLPADPLVSPPVLSPPWPAPPLADATAVPHSIGLPALEPVGAAR